MATLVRERLDRFLVSDEWLIAFPSPDTINLPIVNSDHGPIVLNFNKDAPHVSGTRAVRFEPLWLSNAECENIV